ncbi:MAG: T9SS type A sorting domain-containing protein [Gelidibacter sp.]
MKSSITIIFALLISLPIIGQDIAAFSGTKTPAAVTIPNMTSEPLSRGPGLTVGSGPTFNSGNWTTSAKLDTNHYIQWSVTAAAGYIINITELQINYDRDPDGMSHFFTGNGPAKIKIRTSLDNFKSDIYSNEKVSNSGQSPIIKTTLYSEPGGTITFRLYGYSANIGMLGPLGNLDIEGGLGKVLGLDNTGIRLAGNLTYDGLLYSNGKWTPHAPNAQTGNKNTLILNGIYTEASNVKVRNLKVSAEAGIIIQKTGSITVNGDLETSNNLTLKSDSDDYSSLIVKGEVTGTAKYQREVQTKNVMGVTRNEVLISAPLTGESFKAFRAANPNILSNSMNSLFLFGPFNKITGTFSQYTNTEKEVFKAANGYKATSTNNGSFTFTGMVNTNEIKKNILNSGPAYAEWNLIGNPYPSYIKLSEFLNANNPQLAPTSAGIYVYDPKISNGWIVQNLAYLTLHPNTKIKPGQGFMMASKTGGGTISFTPSMRTTGKTDNFKVNTDTIAKNVGFLKLNLSSGILNYSTEFYFNDLSTRGLDPGYDAGVYGSQTPDFAIYSHLVENNSGLDLAIQSLPYTNLLSTTIIPLGVNASADQKITLSIADAIIPEETEVYLEDRLTNNFTLLNSNNYTFFTNSKTSKTGRFFLHLTNSTLTFGSNGKNLPEIFATNGSHILHVKGLIEPNSIVSIYDLQGRLMLSVQLDNNSKNNQINISTIKSGMYLVKFRAGSLEKVKKIFIK